jgi:protein ImuB
LATLVEKAGRLTVRTVDRRARLEGILPGTNLADARAMLPDLKTMPDDPMADAALLARLADWCTRFTPWTAPDGADGVFLDLTGCAHLFGGETALLADLQRRLTHQGFAVRAAIADTTGAAWALARFGHQSRSIVPPGTQKSALSSLPVVALRLPGDMVAGLNRLGLTTIGALYPLPRAPLARRFGALLHTRLDQALDSDAEPISPRQPPPCWRVRLDFAEPIARPEDIAAGLDHLLTDLCRRLAQQGMGARTLDYLLFLVDGDIAKASIGTVRPLRNVKSLSRLFAGKIAVLDPGLGVDCLMLAAAKIEPLSPEQAALDGIAAGERSDDFDSLIDRLVNRLGMEAIVRAEPVASHIPEGAVRWVSPMVTVGPIDPPPERRPRPIRLLPRPEPIEVMAPVPDDPPLHFTWRRTLHRVRHAEGPERIAPEWWQAPSSASPEARDYYRVEDQAGGRFWLYRDGPYRPDQPARWFLHGFFA